MTRQSNSYYDNFLTTLADGAKAIYISDGKKTEVVSTANAPSTRSGASSGSSSSRAITGVAVSLLHSYLLNQTLSKVNTGKSTQVRRSNGSYGSGASTVRAAQLQDTELFFDYLQNGKVINLTEVLEKADPNTKVFYIPTDYYYIGDDDIPSYSQQRAEQVIAEYAAENQNQGNAVATSAAMSAATSAQSEKKWLWLLLPIGALLIANMLNK